MIEEEMDVIVKDIKEEVMMVEEDNINFKAGQMIVNIEI